MPKNSYDIYISFFCDFDNSTFRRAQGPSEMKSSPVNWDQICGAQSGRNLQSGVGIDMDSLVYRVFSHAIIPNRKHAPNGQERGIYLKVFAYFVKHLIGTHINISSMMDGDSTATQDITHADGQISFSPPTVIMFSGYAMNIHRSHAGVISRFYLAHLAKAEVANDSFCPFRDKDECISGECTQSPHIQMVYVGMGDENRIEGSNGPASSAPKGIDQNSRRAQLNQGGSVSEPSDRGLVHRFHIARGLR